MQRSFFFISFLLFLMACDNDSKNDPVIDPPPPATDGEIVSLSINSEVLLDQARLEVGSEAQLSSVAQLTSGESVPVAAQWSVEPAELASIDENGLLKALAEGQVTVTATYQDFSDSLQFEIFASPAPIPDGVELTDLSMRLNDELVSASELTIQTFDTYRLSAFAQYSNAEEREVEAEWEVSDSELARLENGTLEGLKAGKVNLTARFDGMEKVFVVEVIDHPEQELVIVLAAPTVEDGSSLTFKTNYRNSTGELAAVEASCSVSPESLAEVGENKSINALKAGSAELTCTYQHLSTSVGFEITVKPVLVGLRITDPGKLEIGTVYQMSAIGQFDPGAVEEEVSVVWSVVDDNVDLTLVEDGRLVARKVGTATIAAVLDGVTASIGLDFARKEVKIVETQYWAYETDEEGKLTFNFPWDEEEGDAIKRDAEGLTDFALTCAEQAQNEFQSLLADERYQAAFDKTTGWGATAEAIILVNVVDQRAQHQALRMMDRDAYFWHWNNDDKKPVLSMSQFRKGQWVWEVIAMGPNECIQPPKAEMARYLEYVNSRLAPVQ
ncbi:MAG: Ig-like domain-containing protein [Oligoflexus sp.]